VTTRRIITVPTTGREGLTDITPVVREFAETCGLHDGLVNVYVRGATAAIMIH
jgi:thiamine phosphate synthase YjbQ (UPF0047 family)